MSIVEVVFAASLLFIMMGVTTWLMDSGNRAYGSVSSATNLETSAARSINRIVDLMRMASFTSVNPRPRADLGMSTSSIQFQIADEVAPQRIRLVAGTGQLARTRDLGTADEMDDVWSHDVADLLQGEEVNGVDDNGNGLVDEEGLCFTFDGNVLVVRLTVTDTGSRGETITRTFESRVAFRQ